MVLLTCRALNDVIPQRGNSHLLLAPSFIGTCPRDISSTTNIKVSGLISVDENINDFLITGEHRVVSVKRQIPVIIGHLCGGNVQILALFMDCYAHPEDSARMMLHQLICSYIVKYLIDNVALSSRYHILTEDSDSNNTGQALIV